MRQEVGFSPLDLPKVSGYNEQTVVGLNNAFAGYCLYTYLGILLYMVIQLAREREYKSREGMKMMGLEDPTYYLGWFILFFAISCYNALCFTIVYSIFLDNINPIMIFFFLILYGQTIFGSAWIMVAILPNLTGAVILAIVYHFLTFQFA